MRTGIALKTVNPSNFGATSDAIKVGDEDKTTILVINDTSKNFTIHFQGSIVGPLEAKKLYPDNPDKMWCELDSKKLVAIIGDTPNTYMDVLEDPWPYIRVLLIHEDGETFTSSDQVGTLWVQWAARRSRQNVI